MVALIWVAPGGSQFSCIRIGGQRPTHWTPYMCSSGCHQSCREQLRYVLGSGSGANRYRLCSFQFLRSHVAKFDPNLSHINSGGINFIHNPSTYFNKMQSHRQKDPSSWVAVAPSTAPMKVTRERASGCKRPSSVKRHKNKTAVVTEIALPRNPHHSLSQPFYLSSAIRLLGLVCPHQNCCLNMTLVNNIF